MTNFCLFKKRLENVKFIRTLKQDRSKAKTSLKSVLSLQVNINQRHKHSKNWKRSSEKNIRKQSSKKKALFGRIVRKASEKIIKNIIKKIIQFVHLNVKKVKKEGFVWKNCQKSINNHHQKNRKKNIQKVHIIVRKIKFSVYAQPFVSFLDLSK